MEDSQMEKIDIRVDIKDEGVFTKNDWIRWIEYDNLPVDTLNILLDEVKVALENNKYDKYPNLKETRINFYEALKDIIDKRNGENK